MNTHSAFIDVDYEKSDYQNLIPDIDRLPKAPTSAGPEWQAQKRREALHILSKCCDIWAEADKFGFLAIRDKMEPVIMHAHDAFVRLQTPSMVPFPSILDTGATMNAKQGIPSGREQ